MDKELELHSDIIHATALMEFFEGCDKELFDRAIKLHEFLAPKLNDNMTPWDTLYLLLVKYGFSVEDYKV